MRSLAVIESSLRLVASRHFRDSSTASKVLVLVSINEFQWIYNTHGLVSMQQVHCIEARLALDVDKVPEVPTHKEIDFLHRAGSDMSSIVGIFRGKDRFFDVLSCKLFHLGRDSHECSRIKRFAKKLTNATRGICEFIECDGRTLKKPLPGLHLTPKLACGFLPLIIEVAAQN